MSAVRNIQSTMLRQISSVVQDEISEMSEPDVISQSPQLKYVLYCYAAKMLSLLLCFASLFFLTIIFYLYSDCRYKVPL